MITIDKIAENLFDKIRSRFEDISIGDEKMKKTVEPSKARFFTFQFAVPNEDGDKKSYGRITISLVDTQSLKVFYDMEIDKNMSEPVKKQWYKFVQGLRKFAKRNMMDSFDIRDIAKSGLKTKDLKHLAKDADVFDSDELMESKLTGTSRSSYQVLENARIIVRHNKRIQENENGELPRNARSTHIDTILIENESGERFKLPKGTTINEARVIARHVRNEGTIHDEFGQHLMEMLSEMHQLKTFVRNMRGRTFEDQETQAMLESAQDHWGETHSNFFSMRTQSGYQKFRESWTPSESILTDEIDVDAMRSRFEKRLFDDRLEGALPIVARAYNQRKTRMEEEFGAWMESVINDSFKRMITEDVDPHAPQDSQSPLSVAGPQDPEMDQMDPTNSSSIDHAKDSEITEILRGQDFTFQFRDGQYFFNSAEERERALDWMARDGVQHDEDDFKVEKFDPQPFGSSTNEPSIRNDVAMESSVQTLKVLAGIR